MLNSEVIENGLLRNAKIQVGHPEDVVKDYKALPTSSHSIFRKIRMFGVKHSTEEGDYLSTNARQNYQEMFKIVAIYFPARFRVRALTMATSSNYEF